MSTTSSDLEGGPRSKIHLLDLSRELRDRIYGFIVDDRYMVFPYLRQRPPALRGGDDFRHLSILRVSKCFNREVMQVLQRKSWFICKLTECPLTVVQEAPTQHMMNIELIIGDWCSWRVMRQIIGLNFAGTEILRRTCHILIPELLGPFLKLDRTKSHHEALRLCFQHIKLLTGFATVVVQVDLSRKKKKGVEYNDNRAKLLWDMIEFSEPALGPAVPCDSVRKRYDVNFRFSPRRFVAQRLASAEFGVENEEHKEEQ